MITLENGFEIDLDVDLESLDNPDEYNVFGGGFVVYDPELVFNLED